MMSRGLSNFVEASDDWMEATSLHVVRVLTTLRDTDVRFERTYCLDVNERIARLGMGKGNRGIKGCGFEVAIDGIQVCADQPPEPRAICLGGGEIKKELALSDFVSWVRDSAKIKATKDVVQRKIWHFKLPIDKGWAAEQGRYLTSAETRRCASCRGHPAQQCVVAPSASHQSLPGGV